MILSAQTSSPWMVEFHKRLLRGYSVILYGNISDQYLCNSRYVSMADFLQTYFDTQGYDIIGQWDALEGIRFLTANMRATAFDNVQQISPGLGGVRRSSTPATDQQPPSVPLYGELGKALAFLRVLLGSSQHSCAMILCHVDKLFSDPTRQLEKEKACVIGLRRVLEETAYIEKPPLAGRKNTVVLLAHDLSLVPPWLYRENPRTTLLQVGNPTKEERAFFAKTYLDQFYGSEALAATERETTPRWFAELTEGMTAWDLEAIRRTSVAEDLPITQTKSLVDYFKYGQRDDPWEHLDPERIRSAQTALSKRVIGQPRAIASVVDMLLSARVGIRLAETGPKTGSPKGVFFFVGPTGVGKTELAKALTALIFGDETVFARFDMSEYAQEHAAEKLTGAPPGYAGYNQGGHLTNQVLENPFRVLLFDEIEKAHHRVMDTFLQVLEDGRLTDGKGQTAYFSQSVIIFTSNLGSQGLADRTHERSYEEIRTHYLQAVERHITVALQRPELLNRLGSNILVFDVLRPQFIGGIAGKLLHSLAGSAWQRHHLRLEFPETDGVLARIERWMLEGEHLAYGGRRVKTLLEERVERPLNRWVFETNPPPGSVVSVQFPLAGITFRHREGEPR